MTFIYEWVPDEMRDTVHQWNLKRAQQDEVSLRWTVDRERDVFLICYSLGRAGPGPNAQRGQYALSVQAEPVLFEAQIDTLVDETDPGGYRRFTTYPPRIPQSWLGRKGEIEALIVEALTAMNKERRTEVQFFQGSRQ